METANRLEAAGLNQQLRDVRSFSFFQLANLLRRFSVQHNESAEVPLHVRYRALPSLAFPAADVDCCDVESGDFKQFLDVTVTFMGLFGPASPLPAFYTERIIQALDQKSPSRDLMDIFNHRCISLLDQCWQKYRYYISYHPAGTDQYTRWLLSLVGAESEQFQLFSRLRWHKLLPYVGVLANNVCSSDLLCKIVGEYFGVVTVQIQSLIYREVQIPMDQLSSLGSQNSSLSQDLVLGEQVADYSGKFVLQLSKLNSAQYQYFLPGTEGFRELLELVFFALKDPLEFDLELEPVFAESNVVEPWGRLGWNCLLGDQRDKETVMKTVICVKDFQNF